MNLSHLVDEIQIENYVNIERHYINVLSAEVPDSFLWMNDNNESKALTSFLDEVEANSYEYEQLEDLGALLQI